MSDTIHAHIAQLATAANQGCGLSYDLYVERFSAAVDRKYPPGSPLREVALALATTHGYATVEERAATADSLFDDGSCSPGIDRNCPVGCGDIG